MGALKTIGNIFAAILIFFGVLFIWGAFSDAGSPGWIIIGAITVLVGFVIIFFANRKKSSESSAQHNTTLNIQLPGDVAIERFQCQDCGAQLSMDNVKMVAGAPMVDCPYCGAAYQLTEEPKW